MDIYCNEFSKALYFWLDASGDTVQLGPKKFIPGFKKKTRITIAFRLNSSKFMGVQE